MPHPSQPSQSLADAVRARLDRHVLDGSVDPDDGFAALDLLAEIEASRPTQPVDGD